MPACAIPGAVGELAASRHGVVTRGQAAEHLTVMAVSRLCQRGVFREPAPGVLAVSGAPATFEQRCYIATVAAGGHGIIIGGTAARLYGLDGFDTHGEVLAALPRGGRMPFAGATATQRREFYPDRSDVVRIEHIACSSLARTVADLARYHPERYERAADDFQRRGCSLTWLQHTLERMPRQRSDGLDLAFADLARRQRGGVVRGSWFEQLVEACLASPRIPTVVRQHSVHSPDGRFVARPDLAIPQLRLAIEANSRRHHTGPTHEAFDQRRDNLLGVEGWHTSYVGWTDTSTPASVCRTIERIVARRAADLGIDLEALCRSTCASGSATSRHP